MATIPGRAIKLTKARRNMIAPNYCLSGFQISPLPDNTSVRLHRLALLAPQRHTSLANGLNLCAQSALKREKLI